MNEPKLVLLDTFSSREEAISVQAVLKGEGIFSQIDENFSSSAFPSFQLLNGIKLYVAEEQLEHAQSVLENVQPFIENPDDDDLPQDHEPVEEITASKEQELEPVIRKGCFLTFLFYCFLVGVGIVLGYFLTVYGFMDPVSRALYSDDIYQTSFDLNSDGQDDLFATYSGDGTYLSHSKDNNFDGKIDEWSDYKMGFVSNTKTDLNYDGTADAWAKLENGNLISLKVAGNLDQKPSQFYFYDHGLIKSLEWRTPEGKVVRKEIFKDGILSEIYKLNANGQLRLAEKIGPQGHQLPIK